MPRLQLKDFGGARPKLVPEDLEESPSLLTIAAVELVEVPDATAPTGLRKSVTLTFKEFPDRVLWLNRGQIETLMHRLGDDTDSWIGEIVPVESYVAEFRGQRFPKVRVMVEDSWGSALSAAQRVPRPMRSVKGSGGRR